MGNKVVGVFDDNHFQLVFPLKGLMRISPPALAAFALLGALPFTPCRAAHLAAQQQPDEERTTIGGYGEVHYQNASGPDSPGIVNVARFVVFLAHQFNERIAFRSELEVEDTKVEAGATDAGEVSV